MLYIIIGLIIIGVIVLYLSFDDKTKEEDSIDITKTDIYNELKDISIKNDNILKLKQEVKKYIIGTDNLINSIIVSILSDGHILVEGVPGLAKTRTILVFSKLLGLDFKRVQFTPDMLPSDIIGGEIYNKNTGKFEIFKGPIFTNLLLADEINRATPKVQSALLEAMQEKKVTIGNETFSLSETFFVMATQNPLEQEGTFPLPEAQLDRFLFKVNVSYPSKVDEKNILDTFDKNISDIESILDTQTIISMQEEVKKVRLPEKVKDYIVNVVDATRKKDENIEIGASTRAIIAFKKASAVLAYLDSRNEVVIDDVKKLILPILRHRVKLSYKTESLGENIDEVLIKKLININDL